MKNVHDNILELIGNTPLVKLNKTIGNTPTKVYAKLEYFNPGHSAKDRITLHIVENAEKKGLLNPDSVIVETTSGNTGFALAMVAIIKGYKCIPSTVNCWHAPPKIRWLPGWMRFSEPLKSSGMYTAPPRSSTSPELTAKPVPPA